MAQAVAPQAPVLMARTRDTQLITPVHGNMITWTSCIFLRDFVLDVVLMCLSLRLKIKELLFFTFHSYCVVKSLAVFFNRIERKIATISLESRDGPGRLGESERGKNFLPFYFI